MDEKIKGFGVKQSFLIMTLILSEQQSHKFVRISKNKCNHGGIILLGKGTVKNSVLNLFGIKSERKEIVNVLVERENAEEMMDFFAKELHLYEIGHGIAYTSPVTIADQIINNDQDTWNAAEDMEGDSMFKKLTVVVDRGMAEDIMDVARKSGVKGGTILHGRGTGWDCSTKFFGMEIEPEKDLVMIIMPSDLVSKVVNDLFREFQLDVPGNGILFVEPIIEVRGLFDSHNKVSD